jgi:hypothetical protein
LLHSAIGDKAELLVSAALAGSGGNLGLAYVVYGESSTSAVDLSQSLPAAAGFEIDGTEVSTAASQDGAQAISTATATQT